MSEVTLRRKPARTVASWLQPLVVVVLLLVTLGIPFWVVIVTAGKDVSEARTPDLTLPTHWALWDNIVGVFTDGRIGYGMIGSLLLLVPSVVLLLLLGSLASWVLARRKSRMITIAYALGISGIIVPPAIVTVVLLLKYLGLNGTILGMVGVYVGCYLSVVIFFVTGFIRTIPIELEEAARVDGARPIAIFFRIILPLLGPVISTATILICLFIWNDLFFALFIISGHMDTVTLDLYGIATSGTYLQNWNLVFTYVILMTVPLVIVFIIAQRRIISGVTGGAVK